MERCDCKPNGDCLAYRGELPANQTCVEKCVNPNKVKNNPSGCWYPECDCGIQGCGRPYK